MESWRYIFVGAAAIVPLGVMWATMAGMFSRTSSAGLAEQRRATAFESALVGGETHAGSRAFDTFAYRVAARFAGKTRIVVGPTSAVIAGPRVPSSLYRVWIWVQGLLLAGVPAFLVWALVDLDWRPLALGVAVFGASGAISSLGAGLWPGLGELEFATHGAYSAVEFPLSAVSDVAIGAAWSRGGMEIVLLPYKKGVDAMAGRNAVSFFAPDEHGREVRYALHCPEAADAEELARMLRSAAE